ncbi:MAG TPA: sugar phosphate isomerase/epimerase family protein [Verrucomicrobiae bacterium]|nr:sugar phosphate isomerase/epimerase family protein [Verrucomicrobiae bacterium]
MKNSVTFSTESISRREFALGIARGSVGLAAIGTRALSSIAAEGIPQPIVIFSKAYQPLKMTFDRAAEFTAEAGLDGVDSPVRPDGEIKPENAVEELPMYVEALRKRGLNMPYITTAITSPDSPHAEALLTKAKDLGITRYRLGFMERRDDAGWPKQLAEVRARLKDLAGLNKQLGIGAVLQNHSPSGHAYVGGNLDELAELVEGFDPAQLGIAFDIAHALNVHGPEWRRKLDKLQPHLALVYLKDTNAAKQFVPLGEGLVGATGYFAVLKKLKYRAPISLHIEYSASPSSQPETRAELMQAVRQSLKILKQWLA